MSAAAAAAPASSGGDRGEKGDRPSATTAALREPWWLKNHNFLVTGATKGIGLGVARQLMAHGASHVMICSRRADDCKRMAKELENDFPMAKVTAVACDVSTKEGRAKLVTTVKARFGRRLDGLVNNVGMNIRKDIADQTEDEYKQMMTTNIDSAYFLCKELKECLEIAASRRGTASVVNVASAAGVGSTGTGAVYGMSKAAMIQMSKILSCEWAKLNIRVNCVCPWMTMTPMLEEAVKDDPSQLDKVKEWTPMHRLPTVEEVAGPVTYLLMPSSRYVTGQVLSVDGGLSAQAFDGPTVTPP
mmetsp:Transcript_25119/g.51309  ORF Transcript_25119/g.51309 Transcript_25119/m.51309 type:complete len:302 (-) Transcript_25119:147-1052(-)